MKLNFKDIVNKCNKAKIGQKVKVANVVLQAVEFEKDKGVCLDKCFFSNKKSICANIDCTMIDGTEVYFQKVIQEKKNEKRNKKRNC